MSNNRNFNCIIIFDKTTILETCETKKKSSTWSRAQCKTDRCFACLKNLLTHHTKKNDPPPPRKVPSLKNCADPPRPSLSPTPPFQHSKFRQKTTQASWKHRCKNKNMEIMKKKWAVKKIQPIADCCIFSTYYRSFWWDKKYLKNTVCSWDSMAVI